MTHSTNGFERWTRSGPTKLVALAAMLCVSCGDEADDPSYWDGGAGQSGSGGTGATGGVAGTSGAAGGNVGGSGNEGGSGGNVGGSGGVSGSSGSGGSAGSGGSGQPLGSPVPGQYHLGPVEWSGSFWNSCAPYPDSMQTIEGNLLAGLGTDYNGDGQLCDACIRVDTAAGKTAVLRVVTTGQTNEPGDIDVSSAAYDLLNSDEYPRTMTWELVACPDTGNIHYQFQTEAHAWWSSFWVRNPRLPLETVEVRSTNHADWFALRRGPDGTWNDDGGFGEGAFSLRVTATTGAVVEDTFDGFVGGDLLVSATGQFP